MSEMASRFDFTGVEKKWCRFWEEKRVFHARPNPAKKPFTVVIPPPNVTGILHMGHALNNTLQDIIIRHKRMQGYETCWMPGTDHAGIATQNVVEKQLSKEGKTRCDLGRDKLLERLWAWKKEYGDTIINQLKKLGSSCDWDRTRFTMDEGYSRAVRHVFVSLYEKGLIYRGEYIINWCPRCQTALSDEEAEHQEHQGALYHIRYPLKDDPSRFLIVATTRPETMLGDTAVAVHPEDPRYAGIIGKTLILPILHREIPIIADTFVDPTFGTGAVKVTPAHDPNDFAMGERHQLPRINIMEPDGKMNQNAGEDFCGMDRFEAREAIIEILDKHKALEKVDQHLHSVGHCYRCHTVVEPFLSKQWFVKMKPLAAPALKAALNGEIRFHPDRWQKVYCNWMENIRDWCISRQIWWGHRIPVWYCRECGDTIVSREDAVVCPKCSGKTLQQDEDVLDTWFSSWLWPFATFGWPDEQEDLTYFYPTTALFTASEIIFFWVARMIMAGIEFMDAIPFSDVFIHGTVRDAQGRKMSKSLGNVIDPLDIIQTYGADALRFSLIINSGQDIFISKDKFEIGRNFANKIWNASRLILMNINKTAVNPAETMESAAPVNDTDLVSRWIISRFHSTLKQVDTALDQYRFSEAENLVYDFFWGHFCDWYLEIIKQDLASSTATRQTAFSILEKSIRMIHPFMPFVTEEIWQHLRLSTACLALSPWPDVLPEKLDSEAEQTMPLIMELVTGIRNCLAQWKIPPGQAVKILIASKNPDHLKLLKENQAILTGLIKTKTLTFTDTVTDAKNTAAGTVQDIKFFIPLSGIIDIETEQQRIRNEMAQIRKAVLGIEGRLKNKEFLKKAPEDIIAKDKKRLAELQASIQNMAEVLENF